jgi:hypothetical protein
MSEENKAILRRVNDEVFSQGNLDLVDELFAPDYVLHDPGLPGASCAAPRTSSNDGSPCFAPPSPTSN